MVTADTHKVWLLGAGAGHEAVAAGLRLRDWQVTEAATAAAFASNAAAPEALIVLAPRLGSGCDARALASASARAVAELVTAAQQAVKRMARAGQGGAIVVVTDVSGVMGRAGHAPQATLAGALIGAVKCLAKELGRQQVSVNVVAHGLMPALGADAALAPAEAKLFSMMQLGKPGGVEHLIDNLVHLIGNRHLMTGQVLHVDDGLVI